jgi:hypothetical protein
VSKRPSFQFYPSDWRKESGLRLCSMAARGLWAEMLCLMHDGEPYGHLTYEGEPITPVDLARLVGDSVASVKRWLGELSAKKVYSTTDDGVIFSRRMVRDEDLRERRASGGAAGAEHGVKGAIHGNKGGRPPGGKTPQETPDNGEITGDKKPPLKPPPSSSSASSSSEDTITLPQCTEPREPQTAGNGRQAGHDLTYELAGMVGLQLTTPSAIAGNVATVQAWLDDGMEPETPRRVIGQCVANGGAKDTRSLKRFDAVVRHDHAKRHPPPAEPPKPVPVAEQIAHFEQSADNFEKWGRGSEADEFRRKAERLQQRMREVAARATP